MTDGTTTNPAAVSWVVESYGLPGPGTTQVLVHGIGVSARYFRRLARELARDAHVLVPDLPGFGRTPRLERAPSITELADGLAHQLARHGVERAVLTGHSMGAQVVAEVARRHPDLAERVVLLGPVVDPSAPSAGAQASRLARDTLREPVGANAIVLTDYLSAGMRWYAEQLPHMLEFRIEDAVRDVECPVLVVRGERDPIAPREWVDALAGVAPQGRTVVVPGAAHVVQHSKPREVAALCTTGGAIADDDLALGGTA